MRAFEELLAELGPVPDDVRTRLVELDSLVKSFESPFPVPEGAANLLGVIGHRLTNIAFTKGAGARFLELSDPSAQPFDRHIPVTKRFGVYDASAAEAFVEQFDAAIDSHSGRRPEGASDG